MPHPTTAPASYRPDLAGGLEQFDLDMDRQGFIGLRVAPVFETALSGGTYPRIKLEQLLTSRETTRTSRGNYNRGDWNFDFQTFATKENGWEEVIDERERKLYGNFFDLEMVSAKRARDIVLRNQEIRIAALLYNTSVYTGASLTTAITNEWDDLANAVPITDVEGAVRKVWEGTGMWPNALVVNRKQFRNLRNCAQIIDRVESSGAGNAAKPEDITAAMLAACFDLKYVLVGGSAKNTANPAQARSLSQIWSDEYAMVCRVAETNDIQEPCIARTFHWGEDGSEIGGRVETYEETATRGEVVRCRHDTDEVLIYAEMGHLLSNVTT